jgi:hypothetical protein
MTKKPIIKVGVNVTKKEMLEYMKKKFENKWRSFLKFEGHKYNGQSIIIRDLEHENLLIRSDDANGYINITVPKSIKDKLLSLVKIENGSNYGRIE